MPKETPAYFRYRELNTTNGAPIIGAGYASEEYASVMAKEHADYLKRNGTGSVLSVIVERYYVDGPYVDPKEVAIFDAKKVLVR